MASRQDPPERSSGLSSNAQLLESDDIYHDFFDNPCGIEMADFRMKKAQPSDEFNYDFRFNSSNNATAIGSHTTPSFDALDPSPCHDLMRKLDLYDDGENQDMLLEETEKKDANILEDSDNDSSSSDSDSDDENLFDTDDEELLDLLYKYRHQFDLEEDSGSELTQVSPLSSFSHSPFNSILEREGECPEHADPVYKNQYCNGLFDDKCWGSDKSSSSRHLPQDKPLPPLIIHTLEEVPVIRPNKSPTIAQGFIIPHFDDDNNKYQDSLLMKVTEMHEGDAQDDKLGNIDERNVQTFTDTNDSNFPLYSTSSFTNENDELLLFNCRMK